MASQPTIWDVTYELCIALQTARRTSSADG
jgi:hypothetical protein